MHTALPAPPPVARSQRIARETLTDSTMPASTVLWVACASVCLVAAHAVGGQGWLQDPATKDRAMKRASMEPILAKR